MDGFQFVFESPQATQNHKKRPRLVTSCDNCRLKKIRCLQVSPDSKCDACRQANVTCRFRDREAYFVERGRVMAGPSSRAPFGDIQSKSVREVSGSPPLHCSPPSNDSYTLPPGTAGASFPHSRTHSDPVRFSGRTANRCAQSQSEPPSPTFDLVNDSSLFNLCTPNPPFVDPAFPLINQQNMLFPLFSLNQPQYPHAELMPHYIRVFIQNFGAKCPFITYSDTLERFNRGILPAILANSIAALAVRFSDLPELVTQGLDIVAEVYGATARDLLSAVIYMPSMETLHALMLLAWSEYYKGRTIEFCAYCEMAKGMALQLGLSTDPGLRSNIGEHGRNQLRATWSSVVHLNSLASSCA